MSQESYLKRYKDQKKLLSGERQELLCAVDSVSSHKVWIQRFFPKQELNSSEQLSHKETLLEYGGLSCRNRIYLDSFVLPNEICLISKAPAGKSLEELSKEGVGRSKLMLACLQIMQELNQMHKKGLIQISLHPSTIYLNEEGVAELYGYSLGRVGEVITEPLLDHIAAYVAPEFWDGLYSKATDVYSLGSLLFFCSTGGQHPPRVLSRSKIPPKFASLVLDCRLPDSTQRPRDISEVEARFLTLFGEEDVDLSFYWQAHEEEEQEELEGMEGEESTELEGEEEEREFDEWIDERPPEPKQKLSKKIPKPLLELAQQFKEAVEDAKQDLWDETRELKDEKIKGKINEIKQKSREKALERKEASREMVQGKVKQLKRKLPHQEDWGDIGAKLGTVLFLVFAVYMGSGIAMDEISKEPVKLKVSSSSTEKKAVQSPKSQKKFEGIGFDYHLVAVKTEALGDYEELKTNPPVNSFAQVESGGYLEVLSGDGNQKALLKGPGEFGLTQWEGIQSNRRAVWKFEFLQGEAIFESRVTKRLFEVSGDGFTIDSRAALFRVKNSETGEVSIEVAKGAVSVKLGVLKQNLSRGEKMVIKDSKRKSKGKFSSSSASSWWSKT